MTPYDVQTDPRDGSMPGLGAYELAERGFFHKVFGWMGGGLLLTAMVAWYFGTPERFVPIFGRHPGVVIALVIVQLVLVFAISSAVRRLSETWAATLFVLYSALTGLTLSSLFLVYTSASIASTFLASGGTFAAAAIYGAVTKKDLTSFGRLMFMGLVGIVLASVVNLFLHSNGLSWAISFVGVFVFIGLTAFDMQKLKDWNRHVGADDSRAQGAIAVGGALMLYLDFINLFIYMLRFMGQRRE